MDKPIKPRAKSLNTALTQKRGGRHRQNENKRDRLEARLKLKNSFPKE